MRRLLAATALLLLGASGANPPSQVFEAPSPEIFLAAVRNVRVTDTTGVDQNYRRGSSFGCREGDAFRIDNYVKQTAAGIAEFDEKGGTMTIGFGYEVRPVIEAGAFDAVCKTYWVDSEGRPGRCKDYECTVTKEPVFGEAKTVATGRRLRWSANGSKYTVSYEVLPTEMQFRSELEKGAIASESIRRRAAADEAASVFKALRDRLGAMSSNVAAGGRKLKQAESLLTDADRAASATGPAGLYRLETIDGSTLPYTTIFRNVEVAEGSFVLHTNGTYTQTLITASGSIQLDGKYKLNGSKLMLLDKKGGLMAGTLDGGTMAISTAYGRLVFRK